MIVGITEDIPNQGEIVVFENFTFNILEVSETKIELVEVKLTPID